MHCFLLSGSALTDHERRALLRATDPETRRLWLLSLTHTTNTSSPPNNGRRSGPERVRSSRRRVHVGRRPCVVVRGLPVSRSRTPTTRCRAGAYATDITPGVCMRALDVRGRGCAGDGLLRNGSVPPEACLWAWRAARLSATAARRRPPTSTLASRCPGGISRADWGALGYVCWPINAQTRHIWLSQLLQAGHRRLEIVV